MATIKKLTHKRGNTFVRSFRMWKDKAKTLRLDLANYTIKSHVKKGSALIEVLTVTIIDAAQGEFKLSSAPRTDSWPVSDLEWDIEITNTVTGQFLSTETYTIACTKNVTGIVI